MDISKAIPISTDYRDRKTPLCWEMRQFAEILFIDRTHPGAAPLVYQLKDQYLPIEETLSFCKMHSSSFSHDAFILLGESVSTDKKKKQILLGNKNTVSYHHLVVVSGKKPLLSFENEEMLTALQALNDALRVQPKIPSSFAQILNSPSKYHGLSQNETQISTHEQSATTAQSQINIGNFVVPNILSAIPGGISFELNTLNRRLYEVQL